MISGTGALLQRGRRPQLAPAIVSTLVPDVNLVCAPETPREPALRCYVHARRG